MVLFCRGASAEDLPAWVTAKPASSTQTQRTAEERGMNPCNTTDPGFGIYSGWKRGISQGQFVAPERGGLGKSGTFDVWIHFHGHEAVRKEWVRAMDGAVLVGIDLGIGSGAYETAFESPQAFLDLLTSVEAAVGKLRGRSDAHVGRIGLSAWSAGYGAVQRILAQPVASRIDMVVLLDGLHAGYVDGHVDDRSIAGIVSYAERAARGERRMFVSHSSIIPPGYASTTETAHWLIWKVGGRPQRARPRRNDPAGLQLIERFEHGDFRVRGFAGNDKMDHCAHLSLFRDVLSAYVRPAWRGFGARGKAK
jgi:hypothetical protein